METMCWECGTKFEFMRVGKRFCSDNCRQLNYRSGGVRKFFDDPKAEAEIARLQARFFDNHRGVGCRTCPKCRDK